MAGAGPVELSMACSGGVEVSNGYDSTWTSRCCRSAANVGIRMDGTDEQDVEATGRSGGICQEVLCEGESEGVVDGEVLPGTVEPVEQDEAEAVLS